MISHDEQAFQKADRVLGLIDRLTGHRNSRNRPSDSVARFGLMILCWAVTRYIAASFAPTDQFEVIDLAQKAILENLNNMGG